MAGLGRFTPTVKAIAESETYRKARGLPAKENMSVIEAFAYTRRMTLHPVQVEVGQALNEELAPVWRGERSAKEAAAAAKPRIDDLLSQKQP